MTTIVLIGLILTAILFWLATREHDWSDQETSKEDRKRHKEDDDSHIYYYRNGTLVHESEYCNGCMQNRADELKRQGYQIEEVHLGRHNTSDL